MTSRPHAVDPAPPDTPFADSVKRAGARTLGGSAWQMAAALAPYLYTTAVSIVAARILGPNAMGRQSYISFIILATSTVCSAGFPGALPRYVGELIGQGREGAVPSLSSWAWRVELVAAAIGASALVAAAALGATPRAAWLLGAVAVAATVLHKVPGTMLSGAQRWRLNASVTLGVGAAGTIATLVALVLGGGIVGIFAVLAVTSTTMLLIAAVLWQRLLRRIRAPREPLGALRREILRFAAAASVPMLANFIVFQRTEFFFLDHYSTNAQIAVYSIAMSAYSTVLVAPSAVGNMFAPAVATLVGAGAHDRIRRGYWRATRFLLLLSIPFTAGALVFGPPLLRLVYGSAYAEAGSILRILVIPLVLVPLGGLSGGLYFGYGHIRFPMILGVGAGLVDVGMAALLVPHLDARGAAIANISAQLSAALVSVVFCARLVGGLDLAPRHMVKLVLASGVAAGLAQLVLELGDGPGPFLLALVAGCATFGGLVLRLHVLPRQDAEWIAGSVAGRRSETRLVSLCRWLSGAPLGAR